ncbi:hypothetical protein [Streptomyces olivaceus]|uniref:hypothetical protein n=1 Tax=Streptomyces olivaceus TaxID=47716 RepID=UPI00362F67AB
MPTSTRSDGPYCDAQQTVNGRIRTLMEQPSDDRRAAAYRELLLQWPECGTGCDACRLTPAA